MARRPPMNLLRPIDRYLTSAASHSTSSTGAVKDGVEGEPPRGEERGDYPGWRHRAR
jgi:hypothetical protein